jgi:hypothetical protein
MNDLISPQYQMDLVQRIEREIWAKYSSYRNARFYIDKWHETDDYNWENFTICQKDDGNIDLPGTLHTVRGETLLRIAIDIGVETPDFIPSIPTFRNEIKADYPTASETVEKAFRQIEEHPDIAVGLANSALESIVKEILKNERITTKVNPKKTLYDLASDLLKEFQMFPSAEMPQEIKTIGSSFLSICQSIEKLRSEKTNLHGKTDEDYVIKDVAYTYLVVNSVATVGLFLKSYYQKKYCGQTTNAPADLEDDLPF